MWEHAADGGKVTAVELATARYALGNFGWTDGAAKVFLDYIHPPPANSRICNTGQGTGAPVASIFHTHRCPTTRTHPDHWRLISLLKCRAVCRWARELVDRLNRPPVSNTPR